MPSTAAAWAHSSCTMKDSHLLNLASMSASPRASTWPHSARGAKPPVDLRVRKEGGLVRPTGLEPQAEAKLTAVGDGSGGARSTDVHAQTLTPVHPVIRVERHGVG